MRIFAIAMALTAPMAWAAPDVVVSPPGMSAQAPDVAVGPDGSVDVVWLGANTAPPNAQQIAHAGHSHDSSTDVFFARSTDGGATFSAPRRLNARDGDVWGFSISKPRIAVGPDGVIHVLYPGNAKNAVTGEGETVALYLRADREATAFEAPRRLNVDALTDAVVKDDGGGFATLAVAPDGTVYAAWIDTRLMAGEGLARAAVAVSRDGGRSFAPDRVFLPEMVCPCCQLTSTVDRRDRLVLGMRIDDGPYRDSEVVVLRDHGGPLAWRRRVSGARWAIEGCPRKPTAVAVRGGDWVAAFYTDGEQPDGVYITHSGDAGKTWSKPRALHPGATLSDAPALAFAGKRLYAVWQARIGTGDLRLFASRSEDGGRSFSEPVELSTAPGAMRLPAVAAHADGSLQVVWQQDRAIRTLRWRP